jgi:hypothetical protein
MRRLISEAPCMRAIAHPVHCPNTVRHLSHHGAPSAG